MTARVATSRIGRPPKPWEGPEIAQRTDEYRYIYLTHGKVALVDVDDFAWLNQWTWTAMLAKSGWYAVRGGAGKHVRMHRLIMGEPAGLVDHIDRDTLNNSRKNLRVCSNAQNMRNSGKRRSNKSGFKGVFFSTQSQRWLARITVNGSVTQLGSFKSPREAADAYDTAARKMHGGFALTNADLSRGAP